MSPNVTNLIILLIAGVVPVYLIIRFPRLGYLLGILAVFFLLVFRDVLFFEFFENDILCFIWLFSRLLAGVGYCTPVYGLKELVFLLRNRKRGIKNTYRKKVVLFIVGAAVMFAGPILWLWVSLMQCYAYHIVCSNPSWATRLSVEPKSIEFQKAQDTPDFSLGYARVAIRPKLINSIQLIGRTSVFVDCSECSISFLTPYSPTYEEFSQGFVNSTNPFFVEYVLGSVVQRETPSIEDLRTDPVGRLILEMIEDPYSWKLKVLNTMPKTYREVFFMKRNAFRTYLALAMAKAFGPVCEGDIGILETDNVRGFILFGWGQKPERICAEVFSKESNIGQSILVESDSFEKSKKVVLSLLTSYRFTILKVPRKDKLREMVMAEIGKHDKFKELETEE